GGTGLSLAGANTTVRGLVINQFGNNGIVVNGNNDEVVGNYIGTDPTGTIPLPNTGDGGLVYGSNNVIGGTAARDANLISGNTSNGVELSGAGATGNTVQGNLIGTTAQGTSGSSAGSQSTIVSPSGLMSTEGNTYLEDDTEFHNQ